MPKEHANEIFQRGDPWASYYTAWQSSSINVSDFVAAWRSLGECGACEPNREIKSILAHANSMQMNRGFPWRDAITRAFRTSRAKA